MGAWKDGQGGQVDGSDGQGGGITGGVFERGLLAAEVHAGFVLTGDVEEEGEAMDARFTRDIKAGGRVHRRSVGGHEEQAGGVEHAALGVDLLAEVLGPDIGMGASVATDLAGDDTPRREDGRGRHRRR